MILMRVDRSRPINTHNNRPINTHNNRPINTHNNRSTNTHNNNMDICELYNQLTIIIKSITFSTIVLIPSIYDHCKPTVVMESIW